MTTSKKVKPQRRKLTAEGREAISRATKKRWAAYRKAKKAAVAAPKAKKTAKAA